jgi:hypothetical protein
MKRLTMSRLTIWAIMIVAAVAAYAPDRNWNDLILSAFNAGAALGLHRMFGSNNE